MSNMLPFCEAPPANVLVSEVWQNGVGTAVGVFVGVAVGVVASAATNKVTGIMVGALRAPGESIVICP